MKKLQKPFLVSFRAILALILISNFAFGQRSSTSVFRQRINQDLPSNNDKSITAAKLRSVFESSANSIDSIFTTFALADGLGTFNAATGVATITNTGSTYTPTSTADQANGKFFIVTSPGTNSITGTAKTMAVGGMIVSRGVKWDYIPPVDTGFAKATKLEGDVDVLNILITGKTDVGRSLPLSGAVFSSQTTFTGLDASVTQVKESDGSITILGYTNSANTGLISFFDTGVPFPTTVGKQVVIEVTPSSFVTANPAIGVALGSDLTRTGYFYRSDGQVFSTSPFTVVPIISSNPTYAYTTGQKIKMILEVVSSSTFKVNVFNASGASPTTYLATKTISGNIQIATRGSMSFNVNAYTYISPSIPKAANDYTDSQIIVAKGYTDTKLNTIKAGLSILRIPSGFTMPMDFSIYRDAQGKSYTDYDITKEIPVYTSTYYIDPITGSDANDGLSVTTPKRIISVLITALNTAGQTQPVRIILAAKRFNTTTGMGGASAIPMFPLYLTCNTGMATISRSVTGTWTLVSGKTNTYSYDQITSGATPYGVIDFLKLNKYGVPDYVPVTSINDVEATPGSHFVSGTMVYVHTSNNRVPDSDVQVLTNGASAINLTGSANKFFLENIKFYGGTNALRAQSETSGFSLYHNNCEFGYGNGNSFEIISDALVKVRGFGSKAYYSVSDGFNYHGALGVGGPDVVEINCAGFRNGMDAAGSNNGSTLHEFSRAVRVNCAFFDNQNRTVHDINSSMSWNVDIICAETLDRGIPANSINFACGREGFTDATKMWLDGCRSDGGADLDLAVYPGATVKYRNCIGLDTKITTGTLQKY